MEKVAAEKKWVYYFHEGNSQMRDLLGGKGAGLAEMTNAGLPVPPGFTITTEACIAYYDSGEEFPSGMWDETVQALKMVERESGKGFGDPRYPLLVSVRSGSKFSMPGMMDTVLNLGLNEETLKGLAQLSGDERFAYDAYRRLLQMFGKTVLRIKAEEFEEVIERHKQKAGVAVDSNLSAEHWKEIVAKFYSVIREKTGKEFPQDPWEQLRLAIRAVFASWNNRRATDYRNFHKLPHDLGTAVSVVAMIFGNMGDDSGSGVAFTRDPSTGNKVLYGEYLTNAQGEDVVAGSRTPRNMTHMSQEMPEVHQQLADIALLLETHYRDVQDLEFTVERNKLYMLQTRTAKRSAQAAVKIAVEMVNEGLITKEEAVLRVEPAQIEQLLLPRLDEEAKTKATLLCTGLNASPGAASGIAVFDADRAEQLGSQGEQVILVRPETSPDDVHGMIWAKGIITARGGVTSHAAVVARGLGKPCVAGCEALKVDLQARRCVVNGRVFQEKDEISLDGTTGEVFVGRIPTIEPQLPQEMITLLGWANEIKRLGIWANADSPRDAQRAVEFGAEGIGLCRTEHMFFEEERLPIVREMILAAAKATEEEERLATLKQEQRAQVEVSKEVRRYHDALDRLLEFQIKDFEGILKVMEGKPVIIRLLDPPLHEFLPRYEELALEVAEMRFHGKDSAILEEKAVMLHAVEDMREANPMMGLRGCRLGLMYGAITEMQVRAIFTAACNLANEGVDARPEVMVPLVGHANEMKLVREQVERVADEVQREKGIDVSHKIGTMVEVPRAALTADKLAHYAEFFSFGTNDLTQATYALSRDDAEGKFLIQYIRRGILPENPFQVLDREGVGSLMKTAVELGRRTRPDIEVGICGEHGGDPSSIEFCHQIGLNYVSASPFRVPVARLAAAQAALRERKGSLTSAFE